MKNLNLINARKKKKLTQQKLAELADCGSKATISNWETGYSKPRLEVAIKVAEILEYDVTFLFGHYVQESCTKKLA